MGNLILAIDQGTSSTKAIVFRPDGRAVAHGSAELRTAFGQGGTAEQNPQELYRSVLSAVEAVVTTPECPASEIACVGIANQRETFLLWDSDGTPISNAIVWQCKRSVDVCDELRSQGLEDEVRSRTGLIIDPYFSGTKLTWLARHDSTVGAALASGAARFGTVDTWVLYKLTRGRAYATDHSNASRTLLFNIHSLDWDDEMATMLGVPYVILPDVCPASYRYGETDFDGLLPAPVPITAVIGDSHSAFFGERCFEPGQAKATLGTGSSILLNAGSQPPAPSPTVMTTIGFSLENRVDYALEGIVVSAGAVLTWMRDRLGLFAEPSQLESIATEIRDAGGICVVPGHAGLGAPFWKMDAKGSIHGLTFATDRRHVVRAALESIPYQIRAVLDAVRAETGVGCTSLRVDGGISQNRFVTQWAADTLQIPVHVCTTSEVTALGAGLLAGLGTGLYTGIDEIATLELNETVDHPSPQASLAQEGYRNWRSIVDHLSALRHS